MNPALLTSRKYNARKILDYIVMNGETSRGVLASELGLSIGTVTNIVVELIEQGLLCEGRRESAPAGRRTTLLKFQNERGYIITCDLLDTEKMTLTACDLLGKVLVSATVPCYLMIDEQHSDIMLIRMIITEVENFRNQLPKEIRESLVGVGLCVGGLVNSEHRVSALMKNWNNLNLVAPLEAALGIPVYTEGITRVKAHYEMRYIDESEKNVIYLNLATGIGMVNIFNGTMVRGKTGIAGEIGHISLNIDGPKCYCGNNGCFEYYCGMTRILERAGKLLDTANSDDVFCQMVRKENRELTPELLFEACDKGSLVICQLMNSVIKYLGSGLAALYNIYDPDHIVLTGYIDEKDEWLIASAISEARSKIVEKFRRNTNITRGHLKSNENQKAIVAYVLDKYLDTLYS